MSPYVITTKREAEDVWGLAVPIESRRAVATLDEARKACIDAAPEEMQASHAVHVALKLASISESGGTVGPLPDGTLIEVAHVQPGFLAHTLSMRTDTSEREVIAAFNAQEATR